MLEAKVLLSSLHANVRETREWRAQIPAGKHGDKSMAAEQHGKSHQRQQGEAWMRLSSHTCQGLQTIQTGKGKNQDWGQKILDSQVDD